MSLHLTRPLKPKPILTMSRAASKLRHKPEQFQEEAQEFGSMIFDEYPLLVAPKLATAIGLEEAIIVQQFKFWLSNPENGRVVAGERWIYKTQEELNKAFPFISFRTMRRVLTWLESTGILISCQPEGRESRQKYYRLSKAVLKKLKDGTFPIERRMKKLPKNAKIVQDESLRSVHDGHNEESTMDSSLDVQRIQAENTKTKETPPASHEGAFVSYDAQWKPTQFTKEQKLMMIPMPEQYPSSDEFDRFVDDAMLCGIPTYRPDLYQNLCKSKWHTWDKRLMKWKQIIHWQKFVTGLNDTILSAYAK